MDDIVIYLPLIPILILIILSAVIRAYWLYNGCSQTDLELNDGKANTKKQQIKEGTNNQHTKDQKKGG